MAEIVKPGVLFKKGLVGNLKPLMASGGSEGTFYLAEDERSLYFGTKSGKIERIQGSVLYFDTLAQFTAGTQPPYSTDIIYFIASDNALVRWDGAKWIQLNATADAVNTAISDLTTAALHGNRVRSPDLPFAAPPGSFPGPFSGRRQCP